MTKEIPKEVQTLADQYIGRRVMARGNHPHAGKSGTVNRIEFAGLVGKWGFVVDFDDGEDGFIFHEREWSLILT